MTTAANDDVTVAVVDDVIRLRWTEGVIISEPAARIAAAYVNQLSSDRRRPMVVDMSLTAAVTRQARTVFLEPGAASCIALLGRSPVDRVIANFVLGVSNLPCPTRFFTSETAALEWLSGVATG
ncbi:MAG: STAS/SEC14 domain-containing protein [Nakamurella sp.]